VSGRSIGSGPACHLAALYEPLCLMLISPIKSVVDIAKQKYGRLAEMFVSEHFNNLEKAHRIKCPTFIIHGKQDNLVPFTDSIDMITNHFTNSMCHLFLRGKMIHNRFSHDEDVVKPMMYVCDFHKFNLVQASSLVGLIQRVNRRDIGLGRTKSMYSGGILGNKNLKMDLDNRYFNNF